MMADGPDARQLGGAGDHTAEIEALPAMGEVAVIGASSRAT
jgi:hypothetical protein